MHVNVDFIKKIRSQKFPIETLEYLLIGFAFLTGQPSYTSLIHGGGVVVLGLLLLIWCGGHSRPSRVEGGGISGPWQFVRHPDLVARFFVVFGFMLVARAPIVFAASIFILGWQYHRMVLEGDQELSRWMGPLFAMYRLFVPSFLPQFLPARLPQQNFRSTTQELPWSLKKALRRKDTIVVLVFATLGMVFLSVVLNYGLAPWWTKGVAVLIMGLSIWSQLMRLCQFFKQKWGYT